jgi:hypothetical protein
MLWRILILFLFMLLINLTNVQTYSFLHFANTALQWSLLFVLLSLTEYLPVSQQPDHVYRRMLGRFFRSCEFLMATMGWGRQHGAVACGTLAKKVPYLRSRHLARQACGMGAFPAARRARPHDTGAGKGPGNEPPGALFPDAGTDRGGFLHQSDLLVRELLADVRRWRVAVQEIFGQLADQPETADPAALQSRLDAVLVRLEARIQEALDRIDAGTGFAEESGNMYRLLGAHRGVSEALVNFASQTVGIDWTRLREEDFN